MTSIFASPLPGCRQPEGSKKINQQEFNLFCSVRPQIWRSRKTMTWSSLDCRFYLQSRTKPINSQKTETGVRQGWTGLNTRLGVEGHSECEATRTGRQFSPRKSENSPEKKGAQAGRFQRRNTVGCSSGLKSGGSKESCSRYLEDVSAKMSPIGRLGVGRALSRAGLRRGRWDRFGSPAKREEET